MKRVAGWVALAFVLLMPVGRSGLPLNAQWGDLLFPLLAVVTFAAYPGSKLPSREDWPLGLYLGVSLLTTLTSPEPAVSLSHILKQFYVAAIFLLFRRLARDAALTTRLQGAFVAATAAITAVSIAVVLLRFPPLAPEWFGATDHLPFFGVVRRLRGALLTPEMFGSVLLIAFVLALGFMAAAPSGQRRRWLAVAILLAAGEFFTFSHSVAGFAVAGAFFLSPLWPTRTLRRVAWTGAWSIVAIVNAASLVDPGEARSGYGVGPVSVEILGMRIEGRLMHYAALKQVAWESFVEHPLTGVGPGRFPAATEAAFQEGRLTARYRNKPPQCDALGRLAESGFFGGLSLALLWLSWCRPGIAASRALHPLQRASVAAVVGLLVNSVNADVMNFRFLWIVASWAALRPAGDEAEPALAASRQANGDPLGRLTGEV